MSPSGIVFDGAHYANCDSIVVCHGLYSREVGSSDGYWSQKLWLEDLLQDYINDCRVLVYEFNEDKSGEKILSRNGVERAARELLEKLNEDTSVSQVRAF